MKRRERFMAATGWNVDPRVGGSGQSRNGQERCIVTTRVPNRFAAEVGL